MMVVNQNINDFLLHMVVLPAAVVANIKQRARFQGISAAAEHFTYFTFLTCSFSLYIFYHKGFALSIGTISISAKLFAHPKLKMHTPNKFCTRCVHTFWQKGVQKQRVRLGLFLQLDLLLKT